MGVHRAEEGFLRASRDSCRGRGWQRTVRWVGQGLGGQLARMPRVCSWGALVGLGDNTGYLLSFVREPGLSPGWGRKRGTAKSLLCFWLKHKGVFKIITIYQHLKIGRFHKESPSFLLLLRNERIWKCRLTFRPVSPGPRKGCPL